MKALRLLRPQSQPELVDVAEPTPGPDEVVVRIGGSGACHSDLHFMHAPEGMLPYQFPFTLGHESAGWIHSLGANVKGWTVGEAVVVMGAWGCGQCNECRRGNEVYCENPENAPYKGLAGGMGVDGGMAELLLLPSPRHLIRIPEGLSPVVAATLTDAGLTPYHSIRRSLHRLTPGSTTVVIGIGGLGHFAIQILKAISATRIVAVDTRPEALDQAREDGADLALLSDDATSATIRDYTKGQGADLVLDFVGIEPTMKLGAGVLQKQGELTVVGIGGGSLPVGFGAMPLGSTIRMDAGGTRSEFQELLELAAQGRISPKISTYSLDQAVEAYQLLQDGKVKGRAVIVPNEA